MPFFFFYSPADVDAQVDAVGAPVAPIFPRDRGVCSNAIAEARQGI